jgi:hypothetical protein
VSESIGAEDGRTDRGAVRRTLESCVLSPVSVAVSAVEDLPGLVTKGRRRLELQIANARVVGHFVVSKSQRRVSQRFGGFLHNEGAPPTQTQAQTPGGAQTPPPARTPAPVASTAPAPARSTPVPDTAAEAVVGGALADYDTLSASQVVRRLESLGPDELRAVQRYEASTRNRRTILNRAGQLLEEHLAGPPKS